FILRGDEGFGWIPVANPTQARLSCGLILLEDIGGFEKLSFEQEIPSYLLKKDNETNEQWRDRLYHAYRLPIILGALNETKSAYIEIINPLLSKSIIEFVRTLPDTLRTNKYLFKKNVKKALDDIPF